MCGCIEKVRYLSCLMECIVSDELDLNSMLFTSLKDACCDSSGLFNA